MLLTFFNYEAGAVQSPFTLTGIALMLSVISGFFHLVMGMLMFRYRITDRYYHEMKERGLTSDEAPEYLSEAPQG
jgi:GPH family glycoside/pentoside/hexuronide:cation symporter